MLLTKKDFFGLRDMSAQNIRYILNTAETMKYILNQKNKKSPHLQGKSVIILFYEASARAKLAYELAAQHGLVNGFLHLQGDLLPVLVLLLQVLCRDSIWGIHQLRVFEAHVLQGLTVPGEHEGEAEGPSHSNRRKQANSHKQQLL